jgi:hypothetical protein
MIIAHFGVKQQSFTHFINFVLHVYVLKSIFLLYEIADNCVLTSDLYLTTIKRSFSVFFVDRTKNDLISACSLSYRCNGDCRVTTNFKNEV